MSICAHIHTNIMRKTIKTKNFEVIFNITNTSTVLNIIYTATSPSGAFPGISEFENFSILKELYPIDKLQVKDVYTTYELEMITAYLAYLKGIKDLKSNNIEKSLSCGLRIEPDLRCIYMLGLLIISNEDAKAFLKEVKSTTNKAHDEKTKFEICDKRKD